MNSTQIMIAVAVVVGLLIVLAITAALRQRRSRALSDQFGP